MTRSLQSFNRIVTIVALVSLLHCAYSAAQHRFYLRLTDQPFAGLPLDILIQTFVSLVAAIYGCSNVAGDFLPIRAEVQSRAKTWEELGSCPSFYTFDHRSKALSPSFAALNQRLNFILALNVELALVRDKVTGDREGAAGVYRLQFWKDTLNAIYAQSGSPSPLLFVPFFLKRLVNSSKILSWLASSPLAIVHSPHYGVQTTGALISLQVHALSNGSPCDDALEAARCLGRCYAPLNLLRATVPLLRRGIVLLPSDLLILHGLSADSVYKGKNPESIRLLAKDLADVASLHLERARGLRSRIPRGVRPAFLATGATSDNLLGSLRSSSFDLFHTRLQRGNPLIAWQLWWRNFRGIY